jgi:NAD(P)-dependent dehydrogenase (short-subunit alcohol dehydrogenase family)
MRQPRQAAFVDLDVTSEASWMAAVAAASQQFGKLDILVNNAGIFTGRDFEEATLADWNRLVAVNMTGVFLGTKIAAPALRASGSASPHGSAIVNLASIAGIVAAPDRSIHDQGRRHLFTKSTALAFARKGDRIGSTRASRRDRNRHGRADVPAPHDAAQTNDIEVARRIRGRCPIGRLEPLTTSPGDLFLASTMQIMTGSALVVDGGVTAA